MRRAVFLDRDGVLNEPIVRDFSPYPPSSVEQLIVCDGAVEALERLRAAGFVLVCVTNQPDIARGATSPETVACINARLASLLPLDAVLVCPHDDADGCTCRKPKPGLVLDAAARHDLDTAESYLVGDRWRDIDAGAAAGCRTVFVDRGYRERAPRVAPNARVTSIGEAAHWIITDSKERHASTVSVH
jgi:D-glycero-D-manno-heptose 1,7-bisphosphate phosphatase